MTSTPEPNATPLRADSRGFDDTAAMNDIQSLLTSPDRSQGEEAIDEIAEIVARTGRSLAVPRLFRISQGTGDSGLPYATIDAEGTVIRAAQDSVTGSVTVTIWTTSSHDERFLNVEVDGHEVAPIPHEEDVTDAEIAARYRSDGGAS
jgi:hypothetical protein